MSFRKKSPRSRPLQDEVARGGRKINQQKRRERSYSAPRNNQEIRVYNPKTARYEKVGVSQGEQGRTYKTNGDRVSEGQCWSNFKIVAVGLLSLFLVILIAATGVLAHYMNRFTNEVQSASFEPEQVSIAEDFDFQFDKTGYFNVAFIGVTKREGKEELGSRANTVMIASLNYDTGEVRLVSVYRDTLLELEDGSLDLVAHSYAYGGSRGTVAMLNRNLDLNIQHYVTVDFAALALTVNALGGIDVGVCAEEILHINGLSKQMVLENEFAPGANISLPDELYRPGLNRLCGVQALAYTRIRKVGNYDFQRTERQREVIGLMAAEAAGASFGIMNEIVEIVFEYLATNFSMTEIFAHSRHMNHYHIGETAGFPFDLVMTDLERTGSTVIPTTLEANVIQLHEFLFGTTNFTPSSVVSNISANISHAMFITEESAIDIEGDWNGSPPDENIPWNPEDDVEHHPGSEIDDGLHEEPVDLPEPPTDDLPSEPPPVEGDEG